MVAAWVGAQADLKGLEAYLAGPQAPLEATALDRMLTSASVGLPEIDMQTYLHSKGSP